MSVGSALRERVSCVVPHRPGTAPHGGSFHGPIVTAGHDRIQDRIQDRIRGTVRWPAASRPRLRLVPERAASDADEPIVGRVTAPARSDLRRAFASPLRLALDHTERASGAW